MEKVDLSLVISIISICLALVSVFWNIYKETFLRPRSIMAGGVYFIVDGGNRSEDNINITITNLGPGKIVIQNIVFFEGSIIAKFLVKQKKATVMHDYDNVFNPQMPMTVSQYESATQMLKLSACDFLEHKVSRLGFLDNLHRYHWIKRRDLKSIKNAYIKRDNP